MKKSVYTNESLKKTLKIVYKLDEKKKGSEESIMMKEWTEETRLQAINKLKNKYDGLKKIKEEKQSSKRNEKEEDGRKEKNKKVKNE